MECERVVESNETAEQKNKNQKALAELTLLVDPSNYSHLEGCNTAKDGWDALVGAFEDKGVVRKVTLLKQWISLKLSDCESMHDYVNKCLALRSKIRAASLEVNEQIAGAIMLCGLSDEFKPMIMSIESKGSEITVDYVKNILMQEIDYEISNDEKLLAVRKGKKDKKKKPVKCYECGGPHFRNKCPELKNKSNVVLIAALGAKQQDNNWIIDSGATAHMTANKNMLLNHNKPKVNNVTVANNQKIRIQSVGDVKQCLKLDGYVKEITFKDVQYIPDICANLLSVSQMVRKGCSVIFDLNGCKIIDARANKIATGTMKDDMFMLDVTHSEIACAIKTDEASTLLWHRRMGHASIKKLKILLEKNCDMSHKCETCAKGKSVRAPFNDKGTRAVEL